MNQNDIDASIVVFPNPGSNDINVKANSIIKSIQLYDVQGRLLQTKLVDDNTVKMDISDKSKGVYFLKVTSNDGIKVEKVVKE